MKNLILASVVATSLSATSMAVAGGPAQPLNLPAPKGGLYAGLGLGVGALDISSDLITDKAAKNTNQQNNWGFAGRVDVGYLLDITGDVLVGAEVGYNYLPQTKYTFNTVTDTDPDKPNVKHSYKYSDYSFDMLAVAKYLLPENFNVFGKAGIAVVKQTASLEDSGNTSKDHLTKVLPEIALGVGYNVNANVETTLTWAHVFGDDLSDVKDVSKATAASINSDVPSSNTILIGVDYKFDL